MKKVLSVFLSMVIMLSLAVPAGAAYVGGNYISSAGACVMDYETGEVYYEYNGNTARVPASMTKIMNLYCVYEAIENGEISLDTVVPISENVYNKSRNSVYQSVLPLYYNTTYTVDEMIGVVVTYSASGAAIALAELVAGSEAAFVDRMNAKVGEMGLNAYYRDSCGIADNEITPVSMAKLARNIIRDYPDILTRSAKTSVTFHGNTYNTTNHLLDTYYYSGADGLKTGTTSAAGYCFCGTAVRNGRRMISVTMSSSSTGQRFVDTARLLDYGFAAANEKYGSIYYTDMRAFINGAEVPTFAYKGSTPHAVVIAEDLANYGFDVSYDDASKTLTLKYNKDKTVAPISTDIYKGKNGQKAYSIANSSEISVVLDDGAERHTLTDVYNVSGYMCVSVDEFAGIYDFVWSASDAAAYITVYDKTPEPTAAPTAEPTPEPTSAPVLEDTITSESAFIMDYDTGDELFALDADTQKPVASIAKMMTVYVLLDAVADGEVTLDTVVPISENVYNLSRVEDYKMMVNLEYDEVYTLDEMIDMIVIDSAAACVTAAAELLCGSEEEFVKRMNAKAEEIGIDSVFYNGTGVCLDSETQSENLMSAREVAVMTRCMIEDYPEVLERTKQASVEFHGNTYYNLNKIFTDYYYEGADGFKNGMTTASGYCMCGTAERDGKRVITVTLPSDSNEARFTDTIKLFDYGFAALGVDTSGATEKSEDIIEDGADITVNIDGNYVMEFADQAPVVVNSRVLVPIRALMETLEKTVEWDAEENRAVISDDTTTVTLTVGSDVMIKEVTNPLDGSVKTEEITLDAAPRIIGGRTCLPVRAAVEAFGAAVIWDGDTNTILIVAGVC
ncbi:MAG: serine hydrolase [Oscillospiraceae bacterium]|nr:serine hydrolase [Oscillospiraceae bacterium]